MTDNPITEDWLKESGFKWHEFERQPNKHWLLWLGGGLRQRPSLTSFEDIGIELTWDGYQNHAGEIVGNTGEWFCWLRSDAAGRYHRFIHLRHVSTRRDVTALIEAISGRPWTPENHIYGHLYAPKDADRIRQELGRLDRQMTLGASPHHKWRDVEKDDTRGRALPEHMQAAIEGGKAK